MGKQQGFLIEIDRAACLRRGFSHITAVDKHAATIGAGQSGKDAQQGGLAAAGDTDDSQGLALTEAEIQRMISEAQSNSSDDKKKKELADLRNNADGLMYTTEKSLEEYAAMLKDKDREEIKVDLENLKTVLTTNEPAKIKEAITRLEGSAYRIADAIYSSDPK